MEIGSEKQAALLLMLLKCFIQFVEQFPLVSMGHLLHWLRCKLKKRKTKWQGKLQLCGETSCKQSHSFGRATNSDRIALN